MRSLIKKRLIKMLGSVRGKMVVLFITTTLLTSVTSIFILRTSENLVQKMDELFSATVKIEEFLDIMSDLDHDLVNYLVTDDSDSVLNYYKKKEVFEEVAHSMFDKSAGIYTQGDLLYKDILYMVDSYLAEADAAVAARRMNDGNEIAARYSESRQIYTYIQTYSDKLNLDYLDINTTQYLNMTNDLSNLMLMNIMLIISVIGLNLLVVIFLTYNLTTPIIKLAHTAQEIAEGHFDAEDVVVSGDDEMSVMAMAFNGMKHSIKEYIVELKDKSDTETQLYEQRIRNLEMQSLLDEAELKALQMQINPHFLFNTLNAGVQLAMIEGADRTSIFLDDVAKMFRYNVKSLDRVVKISEELDMVKAYGNMFTVRFGDRIDFSYDIDETVEDFEIPPLTIQPFVENATIHGIADKESKGIIEVSLSQDKGNIYISVNDNGMGMDDETSDSIMRGENTSSARTGHTTGIGIHNVVKRLRLFFGIVNVLKIESRVGIGTDITLVIPKNRIKLRTKDSEINV